MRSINPLFQTAKVTYNINDDGLNKDWEGRVFLNPPYSRPLIEKFVKKMAEHNNGIALLFNRCDNKMFHETIFKTATGMKFLRKRIRFLRPDGTPGDSPGRGSVLIAWGVENAKILRGCELEGKYVNLNSSFREEIIQEIKKTYAKLSNGMSFGAAIEALKRGNSIRRKGWGGKSLSAFKRIPAHIIPAHVANGMIGNIDSTTQFLIHDENTSRVSPWIPSVSDIFAEDWEVVE